MQNLLINWVYYRPVGHVIEALRLARDFAAADSELRVSLLLNKDAPAELASTIAAVSRVYSVDLSRAGDPRGFPQDLPRDWDYVFTDPRAGSPSGSQEIDRFHAAFRSWVRAKGGNDGWSAATMPPRKIEPLRLALPEEHRREAAAQLLAGRSPRMSVLLGAGTHLRSPSLRFWIPFFEAFFARHPGGEIILLGSFDRRRSHTIGFSKKDVQDLCRRFPAIRDAFDIGLLAQLALAERCQLHVSPHSGMSFAVQAVGVPWLALSGQEWHEFFLNGVPLISILPDCPLYPCFREMYPECRSLLRSEKRTPCIDDAALLAKLPQIISAMDLLLAGGLPYHEAARRHEAALRARLGPDTWTIVDWPAVVASDYVF